MIFQPLLEQRRDFVRQAHRNEGYAAGTVFRRCRNNRFNLVIGDAGNHRRNIDMHIYAGFAQCLYRVQPSGGGRCPGFQQTGGLRVERCDRDRDCRELKLRQSRQQVDILDNPIGFGGDDNRMP